MIGFFPTPYNDELCYSIFSRYYSRSGYLSLISATEDLFISSKCHPNMELYNPLTDDVKQRLGGIEKIIKHHTMFNYYYAFLTPQKQLTVWDMAKTMNVKSLTSVLPIPKSKYMRYLRYCPICVQEDRNTYGETYWHRAHQLYGISVCHKHKCKLIDSSVLITSDSSPTLITAEESIGNHSGFVIYGNDMEHKLAIYSYALLSSMHLSVFSIADYLQYKLRGTPYISPRGASRNISSLSKEFTRFYADVDLLGFGEPWQLEKLFNNKRFNPYENCLMGLFLGIKPIDLLKRKIDSSDTIIEEFDLKVKEMKAQGLTYRQISQQLNISYDYCKLLGGKGKKCNLKKKSNQTSGRKRFDWQLLDEQLYPKVKTLISCMTSIKEGRPQKVSIGRVERLLNLKEGQLSKLKKCVEYTKRKTISQEEHYAIVIAWAIDKLEREYKNINITNIQKISNLRKRYIIESLPYLRCYIDTNYMMLINEALGIKGDVC